MFSLTYANHVQVYRTRKLPPLFLPITPLSPGPTGIALLTLRAVIDIDSSLTYRLRLNNRAAVLRKIEDKNAKKVQV